MYDSIKARLQKVSERGYGNTLLVLAEMPDGHRKEMTVDEMLQRGCNFIRVVSGNSLSDLDKLLQFARDEAYKEGDTQQCIISQ